MKGKIASKTPMPVALEAGKTYFWCSCGESANQPWCDGSHKGSSFSPEALKVEIDKTYHLCTCKQTNRPSFCDGTHKSLVE